MACATQRTSSILLALTVLALLGPAVAQEATIVSEAGPIVVRDGEDMQRMRAEAMKRAAERAAARSGMPGGPPGKRPDGKPGEKPGDDKGKTGDKDEKKDDEESKGPEPITRPPAADTPADPNELKVLPDKDGKISLQLRGQKWVDVLQMMADWSGLAFDWTELPGDAVNLTTNKKYMLNEARDTFNRMLLDRGYTMLVQPELGTLSVHKVESLNPALVPRVAPEQLDRRDPYELVKVSFRLGDWITAEEAVTDFEHMKSANGTLKPLNATNRIEVVDTVINLRQIRDVLSDEVAASGIKQRIRVFPIKYRNAPDVEELLKGLLGMDANGQRQSNSGNPRMMEEMQKRMQQMMQQQQQQKKGGGPAVKPKPEIRLVVNRRENTIIAHAPPVQMAIIEQAIEAIDVPTDGQRSLPGNLLRWQSYKLASMDPEPLVEILEEIGGFDYNTQIKVDERNNAIVAYATLADQVTIRTLIDKLDGSGRRFYVIKLRRLRADYVAGTISAMMGTAEDESQNRRYSPWSYYGRGREEEKKNKFAVDADIENNWLLVRANENEMEEIEDLLVQLGEVRVPGQNRDTVRYIQAAPGAQTEALLERIRRIWPSVAPNDLNVEPGPKKEEKEAETPARPTPNPLTPPKTSTTRVGPPASIRVERPDESIVHLAQLSTSDESDTETPSDVSETDTNASPAQPETLDNPENRLLEEFLRSQGRLPAKSSDGNDSSKPPPPVSISRGPDGRLIISSNDTRALDLLEDLIHQQAPKREKYQIFRLKYADSLDVKYILTDFFEDEDEQRRSPYGFYFFDYYGSRSSGNDRKTLSERAPIKFIDDPATNSIVVQNGDADQLQTVKQLIEFYDQPDSPDSQTVRKMQFFPLRHASAETVVDRVKEVFVDLLTPNDKARRKNPDERAERVYNYNFGGDDVKKVPKYKGQLLITADAASNTVVVLAPGYVMDPVEAMIQHLDDAATPSSTVQVLKLDGLNASQVQQTISKLLNGEAGAKANERGEKDRDEGERDRENGPRERGERSRERR